MKIGRSWKKLDPMSRSPVHLIYPLRVYTDCPEEVHTPKHRPVGSTEIDSTFVSVGEPWEKVRGTVLVASPDDEIDRGQGAPLI